MELIRKVTVIIPVYNVEQYLKQCIDSVLVQTYNNLEIILVDDGSKDNSGKICDEYAKNNDNIKVVHKQNAGLGMARNTGLENATGEYVTFVDSDDYIDSDFIEKLYYNLQTYNVDVCKAGFQRVTNERIIRSVTQYQNEVFPDEKVKSDFLPRLLGSSPEKKDSLEMCVCAVLYSMSHIQEHRLRFPSERELISEDIVFNIEYMKYARGACTISEVGYNYRINQDSLTKSYRSDRIESCCKLYLYVSDMLQDMQYDKSVIMRWNRMFFIYVRACIKQESRSISDYSMQNSLSNIKTICNHQVVQSVIKEYPINKIGWKQRIFLCLVKFRQSALLYLFANTNIF